MFHHRFHHLPGPSFFGYPGLHGLLVVILFSALSPFLPLLLLGLSPNLIWKRWKNWQADTRAAWWKSFQVRWSNIWFALYSALYTGLYPSDQSVFHLRYEGALLRTPVTLAIACCWFCVCVCMCMSLCVCIEGQRNRKRQRQLLMQAATAHESMDEPQVK